MLRILQCDVTASRSLVYIPALSPLPLAIHCLSPGTTTGLEESHRRVKKLHANTAQSHSTTLRDRWHYGMKIHQVHKNMHVQKSNSKQSHPKDRISRDRDLPPLSVGLRPSAIKGVLILFHVCIALDANLKLISGSSSEEIPSNDAKSQITLFREINHRTPRFRRPLF